MSPDKHHHPSTINHHLRPTRGQVAIVLEILRLSHGHPSQRRHGGLGGLGEDPSKMDVLTEKKMAQT